MIGMDIVLTVALVVLLAGLILLGLASSANSRREQLRTAARLAAIEQKLDAVVAHLGISVRDRELPEVLRLIFADQRVAAIRAYRAETGAGLLEAKNAVDAIAAQHGR
jgi:ribosomal protein L7/L12